MIDVMASPIRVGDSDLTVKLSNRGPHEYLRVIFEFRLPAGVMRLRGPERIEKPKLLPGETVSHRLRVRADKPGRYELTSPNFSYQDHNGTPRRERGFTTGIIVEPAPEPATSPGLHPRAQRPQPDKATSLASVDIIKVLYVAANPANPAELDQSRIRPDEEFREIQHTVSRGRKRDRIQLESRWAVTPAEISQALLDVTPHIVHFAAHGGSVEGSIAFEDEYGFARVVPVGGLVEVFGAVGEGVHCVIVNACSTERLARALAATGLWVVGMRAPIGDRSAIRFSTGFYQALAAGRPVETAFALGVAQLKMTPLGDDAQAPLLLRGQPEP